MRAAPGRSGESKDAFGHTQFSASETTVAQVLVNYLNGVGLPAKGSARFNMPGTDPRHSMSSASTVDMAAAYAVGQKAALLAAEGRSGFMSTILREPGPIYHVRYDAVPLEVVANSERAFPAEWITPDGSDVTDEFVAYAMPLTAVIGPASLWWGRQRFAPAGAGLRPADPAILRAAGVALIVYPSAGRTITRPARFVCCICGRRTSGIAVCFCSRLSPRESVVNKGYRMGPAWRRSDPGGMCRRNRGV